MYFKEEGIDICVNDENPEKASSPIEVIEDWIVICLNLVHPSKAIQFLLHYLLKFLPNKKIELSSL